MGVKEKYHHFPLPDMRARLTYAGRRIHAWWEGYDFDVFYERADIALHHHELSKKSISEKERADIVAESVWGPGRLAPGSPTWSMHLSRQLKIKDKTEFAIFGAERGAVVHDLKDVTNWKLTGFSHSSVSHNILRVMDYEQGRKQFLKSCFYRGLSLFELHKEKDPGGHLRFIHDVMEPGGRALIIDFSTARKNARLSSAFSGAWEGAPQHIEDYLALMRRVGFEIVSIGDETENFLPLISRGWSGWRQGWDLLQSFHEHRQRALLLNSMRSHAELWAERFEAINASQLLVSSIMVDKPDR